MRLKGKYWPVVCLLLFLVSCGQKSKNNTDTAHLNSKGHDRFLKVAESFLLQY